MNSCRSGINRVAVFVLGGVLLATLPSVNAGSAVLASEQDTLPPLLNGDVPTTFDALWQGFDPQKEPLDVEILKAWAVIDAQSGVAWDARHATRRFASRAAARIVTTT